MKINDFLLRYLACLLGVIIGDWVVLGEGILDSLSSFHPYTMAFALSIVIAVLEKDKSKG